MKKAPAGPDARSEGLRDAVLAGRADEVAKSVRSDLDVDARGPDGLTPLYLACARGDHAVARLLANGGADPDVLLEDAESRRREGALIFAWTPLMVAARLGHVPVLRALIDAGANLEAVDLELRTPLQLAAGAGRLEAVHALIDAGADLDTDDTNHHTAAVFAAVAGHDEVVRLLRESGAAGAGDDHLGPIVLVRAAAAGDLPRVLALLGRGVPVDARDPWKRNALRMAAGGGHLEVVRALLDAGASANPGPARRGPPRWTRPWSMGTSASSRSCCVAAPTRSPRSGPTWGGPTPWAPGGRRSSTCSARPPPGGRGPGVTSRVAAASRASTRTSR